MKRRVVLISAIVLIGIVSGIALSQILSNSASFQIDVVGHAALNVDVKAQPNEPLYQGAWYTDSIELNVTNLDTNQGYNFYLVVTIQHGGLVPSDMSMNIKQSTDEVTYTSAQTINFVQEASNLINATYKMAGKIPIDAYGGAADSYFFLISFMITDGAPQGPYTFTFEAYV